MTEDGKCPWRDAAEKAAERAYDQSLWICSSDDIKDAAKEIYDAHADLRNENRQLRISLGLAQESRPCPSCTGVGRKAYGTASTWRCGISGQAVTVGVCDKCWGSGDAHRPGLNLRKNEGVLRDLRNRVEEQADRLADAQGREGEMQDTIDRLRKAAEIGLAWMERGWLADWSLQDELRLSFDDDLRTIQEALWPEENRKDRRRETE